MSAEWKRYRPDHGDATALRWGGSLLVVLLLGITATVQAQSPPALPAPRHEIGLPYLTNFTPRAYGGSLQTWASVQDRLGLMYFANHGRILQYDGVTWRHIAATPASSFYGLAIDSTGTIYAGAIGDLGYLAPDVIGELQFMSLRDQIPEAYRDFEHIWTVAALPDGVYFHSHQYLFRWSNGQITAWPASTRFLQANAARGIFYTRQEGIGLMQIDGDSLRLVPDGARFAEERVYVMLPYAPDTLLVGTRTQGLFLYDGRSFSPFPTKADAFLEGAQLYRGILLDGGARFALGTLKRGVIIIDRKGDPIQVLDKSAGLLDEQVHALYSDREGGLWLSLNNGLARVALAAPFTHFNETNGLFGTSQTILRHRGRLYMSTSQGVYYLDDNTRDPGAVVSKPLFRKLARPDVYTIPLLSVDETLMAATAEGVHLIREDQYRLIEAFNWPIGLYHSQYHPARVYVGLSDGLGVLERVGNTWVDRGLLPGVSGDIRSFVEPDARTLWVGTTLHGVWRIEVGEVERSTSGLDLANARARHFQAEHGLPAGGTDVHRIQGRVLFATRQGVRRFEANSNRFTPDTTLGVLFADTLRHVQDVVEAPDGSVYIRSTVADRWEIHRAVPRNGDTYDLEKTPFLPLVELGQVDDLFPEADGTVWFGMADGVVRYAPPSRAMDRPPPPTLIRQASTIRGDSVIFGGYLQQDPVSSNAAPTLAYKDNALRFAFAVASFEGGATNAYQFMLDGFDETWSDWGVATTKDYTNLSEGRYQFRVRARNVYGQPSQEAAFMFRILPPWYRTWWAYLCYGLVLVLALIGIDHARRRRMAHKTLELEAVIEERTAEIRARNADLLEQKRITEEQAKRLRALDVLKNRFFANVSHEFRTPLTLTIGPLEDLLDRHALPDEVSDDLGMALRNARRLLRLTNQILDIAKLEAGQMNLVQQGADLGAFVEDIALAFTPLAERKHLTYRIGTTPAHASFDPDQFEKVVINLLSNAFKFTPEGGAIRVGVTAATGGAHLVVRNSGPGIPADQLPHLFERFYQVDGSSTRVQPGTGIGLALVKELIELHDGAIKVESEEGFGTTFTVTLPQGEADGAAAPPAPRQAEAETLVGDLLAAEPGGAALAAPAQNGEADEEDAADVTTVLVVDDNAEVRAFIRRRLEGRYRIVEAADGGAGLDAARRVLPDLILSDVMMPVMDGYALCRALKADPELDFLPVILLTAKASAENKIEGLQEGADDYLTKPFDARELEARVENLIASRRRLQARFAAGKPAVHATPVEAVSTDDAFLARVRDAVEANLADPAFRVEHLAEEVGLSRVHLYRRLRDVLGASPLALIRTLRLERAADLLRQRAGSVGEVAYGVGFKSVSHFSQCFREHFGMTPSEHLAQAHHSESRRDRAGP